MILSKIDRYKGGWFVGNFEPSLLKTKKFEVGYKVHTKEEGVESHVHHKVTEYNLMISGEMELCGVTLKKGDLFVVYPGECVNVEILTDVVEVICVKTPSIPTDKELCE
jgi:mannose-6-phosphate isomerase-like protein (cupin superfamily)